MIDETTINLEELESGILHKFCQVKLLKLALTHSSYANERHGLVHNERLEFLGDAVLDLVISEDLFNLFPDVDEGRLTRLRAKLVNESSLARIALSIGLDRFLFLGKGEEQQGGRDRESLLCDAVEAVIGAVFLDGGMDAARKCIRALFKEIWPKQADLPAFKDFKSRLQEITQDIFKDRPVYALIESEGPEHAKIYSVELTLPNGTTYRGQAPSVKKAEQKAAEQALAGFEEYIVP